MHRRPRLSVDRILAIALLVSVWSAIPAAADESADDWQFTITPYLWAPSMNGNLTVRGRSSSVDASFLDIVDEADSIFAYFSQIEVRKGRWAAFVAPSYMDLTASESAAVGPLTLDADVSSSLLFLEFGGSYQFHEWGQGAERGVPLDASFELIAGGRYTDIDAEIDLTVGVLPLGVTGGRSVDGSKSWVDPFVGLRSQMRISDNWIASLRGDIGGFGVGSDISLQGVAAIGYEFELFGREATVFGGYRALYQDYDDGSGAGRFEWDMTLHGPVLGLSTVF